MIVSREYMFASSHYTPYESKCTFNLRPSSYERNGTGLFGQLYISMQTYAQDEKRVFHEAIDLAAAIVWMRHQSPAPNRPRSAERIP